MHRQVAIRVKHRATSLWRQIIERPSLTAKTGTRISEEGSLSLIFQRCRRLATITRVQDIRKLINFASDEPSKTGCCTLVKATATNNDSLTSSVPIISCKVDLQSSTHIPPKAHFSEMLGSMLQKRFDLFCLRRSLLSAESGTDPRTPWRVASVQVRSIEGVGLR